MVNPFPLPRETRESGVFRGNGAKKYGPFNFRIFDVEDIVVEVHGVDLDGWSRALVTVRKIADEPFAFFTIEFEEPIDELTSFRVVGLRLHERSTDLTRGGTIAADELEKEMSKIGVVLQELRRDAHSPKLVFELSQILGEANNARNHAAKWASDPEDAPLVEDGRNPPEHSSFHYSQKSKKFAADAGATAKLTEQNLRITEKLVRDARTLLEKAAAGFVGFTPGKIYDEGLVSDPFEYFMRDEGSVADSVIEGT